MQHASKVLTTATVLTSLLLPLLLIGCEGGEEKPPPGLTVRVEGTGVVVDSASDTDTRDGAVTLREAIMLVTGDLAVADLDPAETDNVGGVPGPDSADTIIFEPSVFPPDAPAPIPLTVTLPGLHAGNDVIDGSRAGVIVDGGNQGFDCFQISSAGNAIKGLQIQYCLTAIVLTSEAENNTIGGPAEGERNIISGNDAVGIRLDGSANLVQGNYIGTDAAGTISIPNKMEGIWIAPGAQDNVIGGSRPGERNVISGNSLFGLSIDGRGATGNVVKGNYIGVDVTGRVALKNRYGVVLNHEAQHNIIGGTEPGEGNVISGNQSAAILIRNSGTDANLIVGNFIGTDSSGSEPLGNGNGIWILDGPQGNSIGGTGEGDGNIITNSGIFAIILEGANTTGNTIRSNSIHSNGRGSIVSKDGGNLGLAPPTITGSAPIRGTACPNCIVDVYSDSADEGEVYEGSTPADTDGGFTFDKTPSGPYVTATATDAGGNTSEFSDPYPVPSD